MSSRENDILVKKWLAKNVLPCKECIVKACCGEDCPELFETHRDKSYKINDSLSITFGDNCLLKTERIDSNGKEEKV